MELLKIRILNGPLKGFEMPIEKGLTFSRSHGEDCFLIKDPAASNPHAQVVKKRRGFYLQDMNSKNGTYVKGELNDLFPLEPGLKFRIGKTHFQVAAPPPPPVKSKPASSSSKPWSVVVKQELTKAERLIENKETALAPFNPLLVLYFQSGVQKSDKWLVGYGPRQAGRACVDLTIWDPLAPDLCFSLQPHGAGQVLWKTPCPHKVLLNQKHTAKKILKAGDFISFAGTRIEVSFQKT